MLIDFLTSIAGVMLYDDNKVRRIMLISSAYIDGLRGNFDNDRPKRILYGKK